MSLNLPLLTTSCLTPYLSASSEKLVSEKITPKEPVRVVSLATILSAAVEM